MSELNLSDVFYCDRIDDLETLVAQQAAVIEQMRQALQRCTKFTQEDYDAMELQPCPEVLNKVRADAIWKAALAIAEHGEAASIVIHLAQRIEQGEA